MWGVLVKISLWLCNKRYKAGSTNSVKIVDDIIPPMTTVASGRCTSEPIPVLSAIGTKPSDATSAVVNTGRSLVSAPSIMAVSNATPSRRSSLIKDTITKPFNIAMPDNAIKPTAAEIEKGISRINKAKIPPVNAKGTPVKMIIESLKEPSAKNNKPMIMISVIGTTIDSLLEAD